MGIVREEMTVTNFGDAEVRWKDRAEITQAWVTPKECSVLLGSIPTEGKDIKVDPKNQRLVGIHGEEQVGICIRRVLKRRHILCLLSIILLFLDYVEHI